MSKLDELLEEINDYNGRPLSRDTEALWYLLRKLVKILIYKLDGKS